MLPGRTFPPETPGVASLGASRTGSLRVDGGPEGFKARTVSLADLGWALVARESEEAGARAGVDEVNGLRDLEGTARQKTRWVDTELALAGARSVEGSAP